MDRHRSPGLDRLRLLGAPTDLKPAPDEPVWLRSLETARLRLVKPRVEHAHAFAEAALESDRELTRWSRRSIEARTLETEHARASRQVESSERGTRVHRWVFTRDEPSAFVGVVTLHPWLDPRITGAASVEQTRVDETPDLELGTWCRTSMTSRGFASEAVAAVATHALDELRAQTLWLRVADTNLPSQRVAERLGFVEAWRLTYPASAEWADAATVRIMKRERS